MAIKPIGSRILIEINDREEKTASGLYIPTVAQEKTCTGNVLAVGDKDISVSVGQVVVFEKYVDTEKYVSTGNKYAGTQIEMDGKELLILDMENVLAVVE